MQGFLMIPYRIMLPTLFPLFIMLRKLRILPCAPPPKLSPCSHVLHLVDAWMLLSA